MLIKRMKSSFPLVLRCLLVAIIDIVLAQRLPISLFLTIPDDNIYLNVFLYSSWYIVNFSVLLVSLGLLFVRTPVLVAAFSLFSAFIILFLSFIFNDSFVVAYQVEPITLSKYYYVTFLLGIQFTLASAYFLLRSKSTENKYGIFAFRNFRLHWSFTYHILFMLTPILYLIGVAMPVLEKLPRISAWLTFIELMVTIMLLLPDMACAVERFIQEVKALFFHHGVQVLIETHWIRLRVPTLLQIYWICRIVMETLIILSTTSVGDDDKADGMDLSFYDLTVNKEKVELSFEANNRIGATTTTPTNQSENWKYFTNTTQSVLLKGCDGVIPLLGLTTIVSRITHYVGLIIALLVDSNSEEDKNMGTMCGILFFVLALQTGLTRLEPSKRLIRLYRNICLLSTAILHFVHSMVHPILMNIGATKVPPSKHARVLAMCLFLMVFPICLLSYLWSEHSISPWLLAVSAFSIEVVIKVVISLLIYTLFIIDSRREILWEKLDDHIYHIKATGNTIEFLFGIFLFCNGAWIMLFESGGMIRAFMMCIHAYFNIWMQAKEGWKVFIQRRTAVQKINSLPLATKEQLERHDDVCSICYQDLESARVTRCRHMFHSVCLRKWLYHQDRCPMCHEPIYEPTETPSPQLNNNDGQPPGHEHQD